VTTAPFARLASVGRLIIFDRPGPGASDPLPPDARPTWEDWTKDVNAVLDAVQSDKAAMFTEADAGPIGILFATEHPERVTALVLAETSARTRVAEDYPIGLSQEAIDLTVNSSGPRGEPLSSSTPFPMTCRRIPRYSGGSPRFSVHAQHLEWPRANIATS
jgi:pimeloyl-ACP methyl ester carboxylesterase